MRQRRLLAVALAVVLLVCAGCSDETSTEEIEFRVPVQVRDIETGHVEDLVIATGSVRTVEVLSLRADTSGIFRAARSESGRRVREGDRVNAGTLIAEITGEDVRLAARTEATTQRYEAALRDYEQKKALFDDGLISEVEFNPAETALADAKIEWERSRLTENRSRLVTPISGVVLRLARDETGQPIADGQLVTQGYELAQVAPTRSLIADVDLVGPDIARVRAGQTARVRHHAFEGKDYTGKVERLAPTIDPTKRTLRAEIRIGNRDGDLRPGMFVEVSIVVEERPEVTVVPREAVTERGGSKVVFVMNGTRVEQRKVSLGLGDDDIVEIRDGVDVGERVVVRGIETLNHDQKVRVTGSS